GLGGILLPWSVPTGEAMVRRGWSTMTVPLFNPEFRDLNGNGRFDPYEDPAQPIEARIEDLPGQMTLAEKAGLMFQSMAPFGFDGMPTGEELIETKQMSHFNVVGGGSPRAMAEWHNALQRAAEQTRLGIPVIISTDPRLAFTNNPGAGFT